MALNKNCALALKTMPRNFYVILDSRSERIISKCKIISKSNLMC